MTLGKVRFTRTERELNMGWVEDITPSIALSLVNIEEMLGDMMKYVPEDEVTRYGCACVDVRGAARLLVGEEAAGIMRQGLCDMIDAQLHEDDPEKRAEFFAAATRLFMKKAREVLEASAEGGEGA